MRSVGHASAMSASQRSDPSTQMSESQNGRYEHPRQKDTNLDTVEWQNSTFVPLLNARRKKTLVERFTLPYEASQHSAIRNGAPELLSATAAEPAAILNTTSLFGSLKPRVQA